VYYQDNASSHKGKKNNPIFLPYSCDLNPIENIWTILKKTAKIHGRSKEEEWDKIDQDISGNYFA